MHLYKKQKQTAFASFGRAAGQIQSPWKKAARKWEHWKFYFFLYVTLPLFLVSLIVRIVETLVRIELWRSAAEDPMEK